MKDTVFNKYIIYTFLLSWTAMIVLCLNAGALSLTVFRMLLMCIMFIPTLGAILSGHDLRTIGFKPSFKGKIRYWVMAWFIAAPLTILGAVLFFVFFPKTFDLSGAYFIASAGQEAFDEMLAAGIDYKTYVLISGIQCLTIAPLFNIIPSAGEEVGWRGVMYPYLKERFDKVMGRIIGGIIWGIWHWPLIILVGYEYGTEYLGAPFTGVMVFCLVTVALGILMDYVYEKTSCIFAPALLHGAFNAWGTMPMAVTDPANVRLYILGPLPVGLISVIPFVIVALLLLRKGD